jgi:hypothetical protein
MNYVELYQVFVAPDPNRSDADILAAANAKTLVPNGKGEFRAGELTLAAALGPNAVADFLSDVLAAANGPDPRVTLSNPNAPSNHTLDLIYRKLTTEGVDLRNPVTRAMIDVLRIVPLKVVNGVPTPILTSDQAEAIISLAWVEKSPALDAMGRDMGPEDLATIRQIGTRLATLNACRGRVQQWFQQLQQALKDFAVTEDALTNGSLVAVPSLDDIKANLSTNA